MTRSTIIKLLKQAQTQKQVLTIFEAHYSKQVAKTDWGKYHPELIEESKTELIEHFKNKYSTPTRLIDLKSAVTNAMGFGAKAWDAVRC